MLNSVLKNLLLFNKPSHISIGGVLPGILLKDLQPVPQVLILSLVLEDVGILVVYAFTLFLDGLSEAQIALEHFFHHVHCVNDALSDGILGLIHSRWQLSGVVFHCYILKGLGFLFEELLDVVFVFDNSLCDYLPSFLTTLPTSPLSFSTRGRALSPA